MKNLKTFLLLLLTLPMLLCAIERKPNPKHLKISVIIPCHHAHFYLLEPLLEAYTEQSSLPEEIVISLSGYLQVPPSSLLALEMKAWPFKLKVVKVEEKQMPGKNRNTACAASSGDLIICQDADDLPHPQRVEAIRYLFENFQIDHLLHQWLESEGTFEPFATHGLEGKCTKYRSYFQITSLKIHNGSVSFLRKVYELVHWRPNLTIDEDSIFNQHAYAQFPDHYVLAQPLIRYRGELSTFDLNGDKGGNQ